MILNLMLIFILVLTGCKKNDGTYSLDNAFSSYKLEELTREEAITLYQESYDHSVSQPNKRISNFWSKADGKVFSLMSKATYLVSGSVDNFKSYSYAESYSDFVGTTRYLSNDIAYIVVENMNNEEVIEKYQIDITEQYDSLFYDNKNYPTTDGDISSYETIKAGKLKNGDILIECQDSSYSTLTVRIIINEEKEIIYNVFQSGTNRQEDYYEYGTFDITPPEGYETFPVEGSQQ
jgi:hypothetical protein